MNVTALRVARAYVAGLVLVTSTVLAQTVANGPYYATPSWDQTLPASSRFLLLANFNAEAVLDRETGLVWERTPSFRETYFYIAYENCQQHRTGGRYGWRLPTASELTSLFDPASRVYPPIAAGHPFTGFDQSVPYFWTSSPFSDARVAILVTDGFISTFTFDASLARAQAMCVRAPASGF